MTNPLRTPSAAWSRTHVASAATLSAQDDATAYVPRFNLATYAGASIPTGDLRDSFDSGLLLGAQGNYDLGSHLDVLGDFDWSHPSTKLVADRHARERVPGRPRARGRRRARQHASLGDAAIRRRRRRRPTLRLLVERARRSDARRRASPQSGPRSRSDARRSGWPRRTTSSRTQHRRPTPPTRPATTWV